MGVILEFDAENRANFGHEGGGAGFFVVAGHVATPVDFVDFTGGGTGWGGFEVAGEAEHGDVAS